MNYQLIEEPEVKDPVRADDLKPEARPAKPKAAKNKFTARLRCTATAETR
jgi:hypothetical protein